MALDKHLTVDVYGKADPKNIVVWGDYRVTVLGERLFRVEHNDAHRFRDAATQSVWYRNMPPQKFTFSERDGCAEIETAACTLVLKAARKDCRIVLDGKAVAIGNKGNLLGTYRTLDGVDGDKYIYGEKPVPIRLGVGVCSTTGVASFDDARSMSFNGEKLLPEYGAGSDEYVFAFGENYADAVRALYKITGNVPLIPRYALGNWWSRYHAYSDEEYLRLLDNFAAHDVPLTVATIDMDWHWSDNTEIDKRFGLTADKLDDEAHSGWSAGHDRGWTGYGWNTDLFPDYKAFLKEIEKRDLKITLNLHPASGVRFWDGEVYERMANAMGVDPATKLAIPFDICDDKFINEYFKQLHKPYEADGVAFWWLDWQQGEKWGKEQIDPLWSLNHYHYLDNAKGHAVPMILSRYAGVGSHRYPLGFSGDTSITWDTLKYMPYFTATASNVGYTWWSHDIGGHHMGAMDEQLYLRFLQFGVFSPINRMHCTANPTITKEPWVYGNVGAIAMEWLRLRHKMIPFLYALSYATHADGTALVEPLYYAYPDCKEAYTYKNEYFFGGLLVAPVTDHIKKDGYARIKMWIPEGEWTDIFTGDRYVAGKGGVKKTLMRTLENMPVLAKSGAVVPFSRDKGNSSANPNALEIDVYNGDGKFTLYEDSEKADGNCVYFTEFENAARDGKQVLTITSHGNPVVLPEKRTLRVVFKNVLLKTPTVSVDGTEIATEKLYTDYASVEFPFETGKTYVVSCPSVVDPADEFKAHVTRVLQSYPGDNGMKDKLFHSVQAEKTVAACVKVIEDFDCPSGLKDKLLEVIL